MQKIGVFVCWCGSNIAGTVDVGRVVEAVRQEPGVAFAADYQYMCSDSGQNLIKSAPSKSTASRASWCAPARRGCTRPPLKRPLPPPG